MRMRILLVEDNIKFAEFIMDELEARGHAVEFTINARDAVERFEKKKFDAVITDIHLTGEDHKASTGFELIRHIRHKTGSNVVIAVTTGLELIEEEVVKRRGADIFYHKPLRIGLDRFLDEIIQLVHTREPSG